MRPNWLGRPRHWAREKRAENLKAFTDLARSGEPWGAQDDLIREFHTTTRKLFQQAGYGCSDLPDALEVAREIRKQCQECLSIQARTKYGRIMSLGNRRTAYSIRDRNK